MQFEEYYAHSRPDGENQAWQTVIDHLRAVANRAATQAQAFDSEKWGYLSGLFHDLGKYTELFQRRLHGEEIRVEHSGAGAAYVLNSFGNEALPLACAIAGHHGGLPDIQPSGESGSRTFTTRLEDNHEAMRHALSVCAPEIRDLSKPSLPDFLSSNQCPDRDVRRLRFELWTRFLLSVLVDADRLDTEAFVNPDIAAQRTQYDDIKTLSTRLDAHINALAARSSGTHLVAHRAKILAACRAAAPLPPGLFSLTVPTGGGKTLSAMSFALRHACAHGLRRVIAVIPFTSIIEQNARVYRDALGVSNVLEHHSNLDPVEEFKRYGEETHNRHKLAAENWDAPIIVTTTVQFLESLFSNKPSRCRKLHNIARSVIILDEVQTLPAQFLLAILDALRQLTEHYGCTIVLSTATPPALSARESLPGGLTNVRPIITDTADLFRSMRRVRYRWPDADAEPVAWETLAERLKTHHQALAVVHTREDARTLARLLGDLDDTAPPFHLSARMCPAHRSAILDAIRIRLASGEACRLVSTQLVEAGVDLDFPVVYRALGGIDSIVQAAGRCNREGTRPSADVHLFRALSAPPPGTPRLALDTTLSLLRQFGDALDPEDPALCERFFRMLYGVQPKDTNNIQGERLRFNFATVGQRFCLIDDGATESLVIPWGDGRDRIAQFGRTPELRSLLRALQPFTLSIYRQEMDALRRRDAIEELSPGINALHPLFLSLYDDRYGLVIDDKRGPDPSAFFISTPTGKEDDNGSNS